MQSRKTSQPPQLALVVPAYNEEEIIAESCNHLNALINDLSSKELIAKNSYIFVVDDGSNDETWNELCEVSTTNSNLRGLRLSRNFGHQNALLAGFQAVLNSSDISLCIDADLQHDISTIEQFINKYNEGYEIVYGVKVERTHDSFFKKTLAIMYYKLLAILGISVIHNHSDFRLLSNRVLSELLNFSERNLYLRGIVPLLGFKSTTVNFNIKKRSGGISKYSFKKMISLALNGVTSFSTVPLRLVAALGLITIAFSTVASIITVKAYFQGVTVTGWSSTVISIYFIGGVQLISLGVIGEYIGKIYFEVKKRPLFIISDRLSNIDS